MRILKKGPRANALFTYSLMFKIEVETVFLTIHLTAYLIVTNLIRIWSNLIQNNHRGSVRFFLFTVSKQEKTALSHLVKDNLKIELSLNQSVLVKLTSLNRFSGENEKT